MKKKKNIYATTSEKSHKNFSRFSTTFDKSIIIYQIIAHFF